MAEMRRRFFAVRRLIIQAIFELDALGLNEREPLSFNQELVSNALPEAQAWRFRTDAEKLTAFKNWLQEQIDQEILSVDATGRPWTAKYVDSAYRKGVISSYNKVNPEILAESLELHAGSKRQFIESTFSRPERISKLQFLYTRSFEELQGITSVMSQQLSRTLANGIAEGKSARVIARELRKTVEGITKQRALALARTEIIAAHAEGQLDALEDLGVEQVTPLAEYSTAGDDLVCFPKFTPIETEDGCKYIYEIEAGDKVHTRDGLKKVKSVMKRKYKGRMSIIFPSDFNSLICTEDHPIWTDEEGWVPAKDLKKGMTLKPFYNQLLKVDSVKTYDIEHDESFYVYNLEIEDKPEFYANGILVHNCPLCEPLDGVVLTIKEARGLIPRHPSCRCSWIPANVGEDTKGQKRGKREVKKAVGKSVKAELPKRTRAGEKVPQTVKEGKSRSIWEGKELLSNKCCENHVENEPWFDDYMEFVGNLSKEG
jgi:hypothetical protein